MRGPVVHGTRSCYNQGCRMPECRKANSQYMNDYKKLVRRLASARSERLAVSRAA